jgi:hypothetical protein
MSIDAADLSCVFTEVSPGALAELCALLEVALADPAQAGMVLALCPESPIPERMIEAFIPVLTDGPPGQTLRWYAHRGLHRLVFDLYPALPKRHPDAVRQLLQLWATGDPPGFLYAGLDVLVSPSPEALDHIEAHCNVEAVALLGRSKRVRPEELAPAFLHRSLRVAMEAAFAVARAEGQRNEIVVDADRGGLADALRWLEVAREAGIDLLPAALEVDGELPSRLWWRRRYLPIVRAGGDAFCVRGQVVPANAIDVGPWYDVRIVDVEEAEPHVEITSAFDLRDFPKLAFATPDDTLAAIARRVARQPELASVLAAHLARLEAASEEVRRYALRAHADLLAMGVRLGWTSLLAGDSSLLPLAELIPDADIRAQALAAIGGPAIRSVESLVDEQVALGGADAARRLREIADSVPDLRLGFWEKRLGRPGVLQAVCSSRRLRNAWRIEPRPLLALVRRHRKDPATAAYALSLLVDLAPSALVEVEADALALLEDDPPRMAPRRRFDALLAIGTPAARARAATLAQAEGRVTEDILDLAQHQEAWLLLATLGLVDGRVLFEHFVEHPPDHLFFAAFGPLAPAAVETLATFLAMPEEVEACAGNADRAHLIKGLVLILAATGPSDGVRRLGQLYGVDAKEVRSWTEASNPLREDPWEGLSDADLGFLHAALGERLASDLRDAGIPVQKDVAKRSMLARCRAVLGSRADAVLAALRGWPTTAHLRHAAELAGIALEQADLDQCADEILPAVLRAGLARVVAGEAVPHEAVMFYIGHPGWDAVAWVLEGPWAEAPELVARHSVRTLRPDLPPAALRAITLGLVALREPCGTQVPDALTRVRGQIDDPRVAAFLTAQRDTFNRESAARQRATPADVRVAQALYRFRRMGGAG